MTLEHIHILEMEIREREAKYKGRCELHSLMMELAMVPARMMVSQLSGMVNALIWGIGLVEEKRRRR